MCVQICSLTSHIQLTVFDSSGDSIPDMTDRAFEVNLINSSDINPKRSAQYDYQYEDKTL